MLGCPPWASTPLPTFRCQAVPTVLPAPYLELISPTTPWLLQQVRPAGQTLSYHSILPSPPGFVGLTTVISKCCANTMQATPKPGLLTALFPGIRQLAPSTDPLVQLANERILINCVKRSWWTGRNQGFGVSRSRNLSYTRQQDKWSTTERKWPAWSHYRYETLKPSDGSCVTVRPVLCDSSKSGKPLVWLSGYAVWHAPIAKWLKQSAVFLGGGKARGWPG